MTFAKALLNLFIADICWCIVMVCHKSDVFNDLLLNILVS